MPRICAGTREARGGTTGVRGDYREIPGRTCASPGSQEDPPQGHSDDAPDSGGLRIQGEHGIRFQTSPGVPQRTGQRRIPRGGTCEAKEGRSGHPRPRRWARGRVGGRLRGPSLVQRERKGQGLQRRMVQVWQNGPQSRRLLSQRRKKRGRPKGPKGRMRQGAGRRHNGCPHRPGLRQREGP